MKFTYFFDHNIEMTHIEKHDISYEEINEFFTNIKYFMDKRKDESLVAIGKLISGRYLEVVYRKISEDHLFIITAYDLEELYLIEYIELNLE